MKIKAYLKPHCGWSNGVRAILRKHSLAFEDIDIINNRANYAEMVQKSGQPLSPCVEIDGQMLPQTDARGARVWRYDSAINAVVFEPLYVPEPGKTLTESLHILGKMRLEGHIDPDLFDIFIRARVYERYAAEYLDPAQVDVVDVSKIPGYSGD